ncbi:uncharacterized protein LOC116309028 [Actinia tenebrosa]|uniref:Uncharacterized protein LOC116309028 n=1 Tax=Actinia tenebrosa TaxID=6105 RepID=A0A6P8JGN9_ACTTE|nr:uncharacterized protein LOC116309028 [Actinia tenebrosa]
MEAEEYGGLPAYSNSAPPLMRSTPRQRSNFSVIPEQYEGNGFKCPDATTERNEHRSTEERITTEIHTASKEPDEQHGGNGSKCPDATTDCSKSNQDGTGLKQQEKLTKCEKSHDLEECKDFVKKTLEERKKFIAEKHLCFACYGTKHRSKGCTNKKVYRTCNKPHPTSLHVDNFNPKEQQKSKDESKSDSTTIGSTCTDTKETEISLSTTTQNVILHAILPVIVRAENGNIAKTYALYDNGSSGIFITEELRNS